MCCRTSIVCSSSLLSARTVRLVVCPTLCCLWDPWQLPSDVSYTLSLCTPSMPRFCWCCSCSVLVSYDISSWNILLFGTFLLGFPAFALLMSIALSVPLLSDLLVRLSCMCCPCCVRRHSRSSDTLLVVFTTLCSYCELRFANCDLGTRCCQDPLLFGYASLPNYELILGHHGEIYHPLFALRYGYTTPYYELFSWLVGFSRKCQSIHLLFYFARPAKYDRR